MMGKTTSFLYTKPVWLKMLPKAREDMFAVKAINKQYQSFFSLNKKYKNPSVIKVNISAHMINVR